VDRALEREVEARPDSGPLASRVIFASAIGLAMGVFAVSFYLGKFDGYGDPADLAALVPQVPSFALVTGGWVAFWVSLADLAAIRAGRRSLVVWLAPAGGAIAGPLPALFGAYQFGSMSIPWPGGDVLGIALGGGFFLVGYWFARTTGASRLRSVLAMLAPIPVVAAIAPIVFVFLSLETQIAIIEYLSITGTAIAGGILLGAIAGAWLGATIFIASRKRAADE
jgi:hypothetical protein